MPTMGSGREIRLTENDDGWWTARDLEVGVTSQGESRKEALENLDEAVEAYNGAGQPPTDDELEALGIDPEANERRGSGELPDILK